MAFDLPVLNSLVLSSPRKPTDTFGSDFDGAENNSDTIGASFVPAPPRSPRILGAKAIARLSGSGVKRLNRGTFALPPPPKNFDLVNTVRIGNKVYKKHDLLGSGGSSQVFKATNKEQQVFALKEVKTCGRDPNLVRMFQTEIETLKLLRDNDRVVHLYDYEVTPLCITLVMELGECQFGEVISQKTLCNELIKYYTIELLRCVQSVHERNIVHSDLKPANFILSMGTLKLIDFGIAGSIPDFTCNVYKKEQIGTVSYMAPESFLEHTGLLGFKVGKPSDLWSCGCLIYEMIYGATPFKQFGRMQMEAIMNPKTTIQYPPVGKNGEKVARSMVELLKGLLCHDLKQRYTCEKALAHLLEDYLPVDLTFLMDLVEYASDLGREYQRMPSDARINTIAREVFAQLSRVTMGEQ